MAKLCVIFKIQLGEYYKYFSTLYVYIFILLLYTLSQKNSTLCRPRKINQN